VKDEGRITKEILTEKPACKDSRSLTAHEVANSALRNSEKKNFNLKSTATHTAFVCSKLINGQRSRNVIQLNKHLLSGYTFNLYSLELLTHYLYSYCPQVITMEGSKYMNEARK
jgi:hypothetical protein